MSIAIKLSSLKPDFEDILKQLIAHKDKVALTNPQVWRDIMASSVGQTLLELIAGTTAFNQFYIEAGFREAFPRTALRDSSVYAIARMLGVIIDRKKPAALGIKLLNTSNEVVTIGRNSLFVAEGHRFFNRDEIKLNISSNFVVGKIIYEGYLKTKSLGEINTPGDVYLNEPGFFVSSTRGDLSLMVRDTTSLRETLWTQAEGSLYGYGPNSTVYYINTAGDGDVVFTFGDGTNGSLPGQSTETIVQYIITQGSKVNKSVNSITGGTVNQRLGISYANNDAIRVEVDDTAYNQLGIYGGIDEKSADYYRIYSAYLYRAKQHAVNKSEYTAVVLGLGGIASVIIEPQRDIDPSRVDLMNVVYICALPSSDSDLFTAADKITFIQNLNRYIDATIKIVFVDPVIIPIRLKITVYIKPTYDIASVRTVVQQSVISFFQKSPDSLGKRIYLSDMISLTMSLNGVDHCKIEEQTSTSNIPFTDKIPDSNKVFYKLDTSSLDIEALYTDRMIQTVDSFN